MDNDPNLAVATLSDHEKIDCVTPMLHPLNSVPQRPGKAAVAAILCTPLYGKSPHQFNNSMHPAPANASLCCVEAPASPPQIEHDEAVVLQDAREVHAEMTTQSRIMSQPPEGRPAEGHEMRSILSQPLEFPDSGGVIRWRSPVLPFALQEGNPQTTMYVRTHSPFVLVYQDE